MYSHCKSTQEILYKLKKMLHTRFASRVRGWGVVGMLGTVAELEKLLRFWHDLKITAHLVMAKAVYF